MIKARSAGEFLRVSSLKDEDKNSYFLKYDELTDVVACPGVSFPKLEDSCYISPVEIFGASVIYGKKKKKD